MFNNSLRRIIASVRRDIAGKRAETPAQLSTELAPSSAGDRLRSLVGDLRPLALACADTPRRPEILLLAADKPSFTVLNELKSKLPPRER